MISWRMAAAWVVALVVATTLTWQIVGLADSQVGDDPPVAAPTLDTGGDSSTTTSTAPDSTSTPTATTTTAITSDWKVRTVNSRGGTVVLRHRPGEVELQAATPASGFFAEVEDDGPDRVRVDFESESDDVRVEARWESDTLVVEVDDD